MGNNIKNEYKEVISDKLNKDNFKHDNTNLKMKQNKKINKRKNIINYYSSAIIFIIIIILYYILKKIYFRIYFSFTYIESNDDDEDENFKPDNETIYYEEKFDSYIEAFNKSKDFINNNLKGKLLNDPKIIIAKKPKISVVIPCFNCKEYILRCIRSIQNQNLSNFEIFYEYSFVLFYSK